MVSAADETNVAETQVRRERRPPARGLVGMGSAALCGFETER